jgi:hypothetical protein
MTKSLGNNPLEKKNLSFLSVKKEQPSTEETAVKTEEQVLVKKAEPTVVIKKEPLENENNKKSIKLEEGRETVPIYSNGHAHRLMENLWLKRKQKQNKLKKYEVYEEAIIRYLEQELGSEVTI